MNGGPLVLALETSCDETAAAVLEFPGHVLASEISSQIPLHRRYGGIVPEVASRNHLVCLRPVLEQALEKAGTGIERIDGFAATAGPGLASSLLIGHAAAKALAFSRMRPFFSVHHLEGHLLSPFVGRLEGPRPCVALIVSGGHTLLLHVRGPFDYVVCGRTRDDAAGEAFDKAARMLGLPYPGGPEIERLARQGDPGAFSFPRSMRDSGNWDFSFSGLKTSLLYTLEKLGEGAGPRAPDLCASFQEAVVEVLVRKTIRLAGVLGTGLVTVSGGVSINGRLREAFEDACVRAGLELILAPRELTTDNAAMIAYCAGLYLQADRPSGLDAEIDPNLPFLRGNEAGRNR
ncbi:MAG TPA: tRNA (adenosine(37)-N6)-threonylcarbamoyltransferase complex transferase subunit TsaD [Verrucomicrobiales bacterium]|nr:tRNA (adenosine(37)-N6)-threonylcarbamoyltransferase complex transferase subunit TsaD [Verrucomicrobiales bacterium]